MYLYELNDDQLILLDEKKNDNANYEYGDRYKFIKFLCNQSEFNNGCVSTSFWPDLSPYNQT